MLAILHNSVYYRSHTLPTDYLLPVIKIPPDKKFRVVSNPVFIS